MTVVVAFIRAFILRGSFDNLLHHAVRLSAIALPVFEGGRGGNNRPGQDRRTLLALWLLSSASLTYLNNWRRTPAKTLVIVSAPPPPKKLLCIASSHMLAG